MSILTFFGVQCDDCATTFGTPDDYGTSAKEARATARTCLWVRRQHPTTGQTVDLCGRCAAKPEYHQQSEMNVEAQLRLFDAEVARYAATDGQKAAYWRYLKELFANEVVTYGRPFSHYAPMFDEEFS